MRRSSTVALLVILGSALVGANNSDVFNYGMSNKRENGNDSFGQPNWDDTTCSNIDSCSGYPNKFPHSIGFTIAGPNKCEWCPENGSQNCGLHRQSPIDLHRDRSIPGDPNEKECIDWHWMMYEEGACTWNDMKDHFSIERHALQLHTPQRSNGDINCVKDGQRFYPRLDYSKGFPNWWWMQRVDVMVPSQHIQEGVQYAAEVTLAHFYEKAHAKNQLGHIAIFLQDYPDEPSWPFLDKLLCSWRKVEEETRRACGLPPAPPYGRCSLFRGQAPTTEWLIEAGLIIIDAAEGDDVPTSRGTDSPTDGPTRSPSMSPTEKPSKAPTSKPTLHPTFSPTAQPTLGLTSVPTVHPTTHPTPNPTSLPTLTPVEWVPIPSPTTTPTGVVRHAPDMPEKDILPAPAAFPTVQPSTGPTASSMGTPTLQPTHSSVIASTGSPSGAPTSKPTSAPTGSPTSSPTSSPSLSPTDGPTNTPSGEPTRLPTLPPTVIIEAAAEEPISCGDYKVNYDRMCFSKMPCCDSVRSDTSYCWDLYDNVFPGDLTFSACSQCCPGKRVGPANEPLAELPSTIKCSTVPNPHRMCKQNSCCNNPRSTSSYCEAVYAKFGDDMDQICHYCCRESQEVGPPLRRSLRSSGNLTFEEAWYEEADLLAAASSVEESNSAESPGADGDIPEGAKVYYVMGQKYVVREGNFRQSPEDDDEYFQRIHADFKQRHRSLSEVVHAENYDDVEFSTYEWMLKVETEYYFRYEGTMLVPPCWDVVHWRAMKDPLRVHKRQIAELHRLLAWRLDSDTCNKDSAGVVSPDGNKIELNREVQYYHPQHRKVFCECKDWPSKFENDRAWCHRWDEDVNHDRFYTRPYSFDSGGLWLPADP